LYSIGAGIGKSDYLVIGQKINKIKNIELKLEN